MNITKSKPCYAPQGGKDWAREAKRQDKLRRSLRWRCNRIGGPKEQTQEAGIRLAIDTLKFLRAAGNDANSMFPSEKILGKVSVYRKEPQTRLFWMVLEDLSEMSPATRAGFAIVFTDFLGNVLDGSVPDPEFYEKNERLLERWKLNGSGYPVDEGYKSGKPLPGRDLHKVGRELAIECLAAIESAKHDDRIWASHKPRPKGALQNNVLAPMLEKLVATGSKEAARGFASILTDQLYVDLHVGERASRPSGVYDKQERGGEHDPEKVGTEAYAE